MKATKTHDNPPKVILSHFDRMNNLKHIFQAVHPQKHFITGETRLLPVITLKIYQKSKSSVAYATLAVYQKGTSTGCCKGNGISLKEGVALDAITNHGFSLSEPLISSDSIDAAIKALATLQGYSNAYIQELWG